MSHKITRRFLMRGAVGGAGVAVALPFLDCFLDGNGQALAATGAPLPARFATWYWGCGNHPDIWVPKTTGKGFDYTQQLKPLERHRDQINVLTGFNVMLDGRPSEPHTTAPWAIRTGTAPLRGNVVDVPSFDVIISDAIGAGARFRALDACAIGNSKESLSRRSLSVINPTIETPLALYARVVGDGFQDPNAGEFAPDPKVMLRKSVLSGIKDQRTALGLGLGAADQRRLDEYFTSVRRLEEQLALQLEKPAPADACVVPKKPGEGPVGMVIEHARTNHRLMADLLVMALACNQTKVANMIFSNGASHLHTVGESSDHHNFTHEEPFDETLGYQVKAVWFTEQSMEALAEFIGALAAVREGDGTLLDHSLVYAHSDTSLAKMHALEDIPVILAGRAGGRIKTGYHIAGHGAAITRTGLTAMRAMRVPVGAWGTQSQETSKAVDELLA